MKTTVTTMEDV
jgi:hypothetical protein